MKLITFDKLRNKLGGRARSSIYLDLEHARLPTPLKLGGRLYWEEDQINKWIKERLRQGQRPRLHLARLPPQRNCSI